MKQAKNSRATQLCRWLLVGTVVLICAHLLLQFLNLNVFYEHNGYFFELSNRFDMDDESSVPTWFSQFIFLLIASAALLARVLEKQRIKQILWSVLSILGLSLAIDEVAGIHEQILQTVHLIFFQESAPTITRNAWLVVLPFVLAAIAVLGYHMIRQFPRRMLVTCGIGLGIFLSGAVVVDILTQGTSIYGFTEQGLYVALEEGLELIGMSIVFYAVAAYIEQTYRKKIADSIAKLKQ